MERDVSDKYGGKSSDHDRGPGRDREPARGIPDQTKKNSYRHIVDLVFTYWKIRINLQPLMPILLRTANFVNDPTDAPTANGDLTGIVDRDLIPDPKKKHFCRESVGRV